MIRQGINRRDAIRMMAMATLASQFGVFERWAFAHSHEHGPASEKKKTDGPYKPVFFKGHDYLTIFTLADLIIPTDHEPGAKEAGAPEFIDFIIAHDKEMQPKFKAGLKWLNQYCQKKHGDVFIKLKQKEQIAVLKKLSAEKITPDLTAGREFFLLVRQYTVMGYYTSRPGMEALGVPTLKIHMNSPACPHKDDPEHKHLHKA